LSVPRKLAADAHAVETSCEIDSPEARSFPFRAADVLLADQFVIDLGDGVLPQLRLRYPRAEEPRDGPHVAVDQLVPRSGEGIGELVRMLEEPLRDRAVDRIDLQRQVRGPASRARAAWTGRARPARCHEQTDP